VVVTKGRLENCYSFSSAGAISATTSGDAVITDCLFIHTMAPLGFRGAICV
jgi:hypothetical protein